MRSCNYGGGRFLPILASCEREEWECKILEMRGSIEDLIDQSDMAILTHLIFTERPSLCSSKHATTFLCTVHQAS